MVAISGSTRLIAHLGVPTENFRAPLIMNPWFDATDTPAAVVPMGCEAEDFPEFFRLLFRLRNIAGALVTMPHKITAAQLLDRPSVAVEICGACNAVRLGSDGRLEGENFDGEGFVRGARANGAPIVGQSAFVLGAGGVGSAIAASLAGAGVARLTISDLRSEVCGDLAARIVAHYPDCEVRTGPNDPSGADIVVNASPIGMSPDDPLPMDVANIAPGALVGDVVMRVQDTPFLVAARERGCRVQVGTDMLIEQIPAYLEYFRFPTASIEELRRVSLIEA